MLKNGEQYIHGPSLVQWLEDEGEIGSHGFDLRATNHVRRINDWRKGGNARIQTADELFVKLGRALGELPEEIYRTYDAREDNIKRLGKFDADRRERVEQEVRNHNNRTATELANDTGASPRTIRNYAQRMGIKLRTKDDNLTPAQEKIMAVLSTDRAIPTEEVGEGINFTDNYTKLWDRLHRLERRGLIVKTKNEQDGSVYWRRLK